MSTNVLTLFHLADSAFPIGASSHSFGLETLTAEGNLTAPEIEQFLTDLLWESGQLEAVFVRLAYRSALLRDETTMISQWLSLNRTIAAAKGARESRMASATLGRRFLQTVAQLELDPLLQRLYQTTMAMAVEIHHSVAFGFIGGHLSLDEEKTVLAYLQQNTMGLVSACQRLLPIGQQRASEILWRLKPIFIEIAQTSDELLPKLTSIEQSMDLQTYLTNLTFFTPLVDLGSMRHPTLTTRLFIS